MILLMKAQSFLIAPLMLAGVLALGGCASYQAEPLPEANTLTTARAPDLERLKIDAAKLQHPLLQPMMIDFSDGLTPDEAAITAVLANPELVVVRDAHFEAAAQLLGAGLLPNPDFSAEIDHPHGRGSEGTVDAHNFGLSLDLSRLSGRAARVAAASASLKSVDLGIAWKEWQVAQAARLTAIRVAMLGRRLALLSEQMQTEKETVDALSGAVGEGDATIEDLGVHRAALEGLRQQRADLQREAATARSRFLSLLGLPPDVDVEPVVKSSEEFPALAPGDELLSRGIRQRLDLRALELGYEAQEARVREAIVEQFPSISVGISSQRNETALKFLGGFVTLGLPLFDRNQRNIATARATRSTLRHEYEARIATIRAEVARLIVQDGLIARHVLEVRQGIDALAGIEAAESTAVSSGDISRLAWQQIRSELFDLRQKLASLTQARLELRVALATTLGGL